MKTLILFGHPAFQNSTINKGLVKDLENMENITFHDLYEEYPEMDIDIDREQNLLSDHDCIIFMFPMFWYSTPAIFKEWQDLVLEHGWAYGSKGNALKGKLFFCALTTGASREMFQPGNIQNHTIKQFLAPLTQTATLCKMKPLPPFVTHGGHNMSIEKLKEQHNRFRYLLTLITQNAFEIEQVLHYEYLNDFINQEV